MSTVIQSVTPGSPAARAGIQPGEILRKLGGHTIRDVMDYKFYGYEERLEVLVEDARGAVRTLHVRKGPGEDLGLTFDTYLMDKPRSCANHCIFCFIDQLPPGLRETLYFKDDDARLSFLLGNYVSLTNLSEADLQRITDMRISPIRISVHATDPELRAKMLGNPRGAKGYEVMERFRDAGIRMQCQIVLCPGYNDGAQLDRTLKDLLALCPQVTSVSVVPVGLTRYREGLAELTPVTKEKAREVITQVEAAARQALERWGSRIFYCGDEFYLRAKLPFHDAEYYEEFEQLENGIGMVPLLRMEFLSALRVAEFPKRPVRCSLATGMAAQGFMEELVQALREAWPGFSGRVYGIRNAFFGESVDVAGLVVGQDIIAQLKGKDLGQALLIPESMLRHGGDLFLDDTTPAQVERELGVPLIPVPNDGGELLDRILALGDEG